MKFLIITFLLLNIVNGKDIKINILKGTLNSDKDVFLLNYGDKQYKCISKKSNELNCIERGKIKFITEKDD